MHNTTVYWVWMQCALGISSALRTQEICAATGGALMAYKASDYERRIAGVFTAGQIDRLRRTPLSDAEAILEECHRQKVHILSPQDPAYPALLRQLPNHPLALYARGSLDCLEHCLPLAIVGTRRADRKSVDIAGRLSADLTRANCVVVSGGALGIDSAAHRGALHAGGPTVAVLGCGIANDYLPENALLRNRIAQNGAVVSEYPGNTPPSPRSFPVRNRIISGLTVGTIVVEAGERSGSLITATCAAEQGRDVFAVPGDAFGSTYTGGNKLIREGAKPVFSAMDVLEEYELRYPALLNMRHAARDLERSGGDPEKVRVKKSVGASGARPEATKNALKSPGGQCAPLQADKPTDPTEKSILQCLNGRALHIDDIVKAAGFPMGEVFAALTKLEIEGRVTQTPGRLYQLTVDS